MDGKVKEEDLWEHKVGDLYEEMEKEGLIPPQGDSEYFWPAMVLRVNRLLYERLNNGNMNYDFEGDDGFYHELERDLNRWGIRFGLRAFGTKLLFGKPDEVWEALDKFVQIVEEKKEEWKTTKWIPAY